MKQTILLLTCAAVLLAGCVTDNGKFPTPTTNFTPKRTYSISHARLWRAVLDALNKNQIAVVSADKTSGIIQTDYIAGPGQVMIPLDITQATRYKYNISLMDESGGSVRLSVLCKVEDTMSGGHATSQWRDVTPQNAALVHRLETWLYEQIENELRAS